jgi:hypothetical protein
LLQNYMNQNNKFNLKLNWVKANKISTKLKLILKRDKRHIKQHNN